MTNKEISKIFSVLADLMEIHGENSFKIRSYSNAAFKLSRLEEQVVRLERVELEQIQGIGKAIAEKIIEIAHSGTLHILENYLDKTPEGIVELLSIKGVGPKKISRLWKELEITSPGELLYACKENRLAALKGFGMKSQVKIIESIEFYLQQKDKLLLHIALEEAEILAASLKKEMPVKEVLQTGQLRLKSMTIDKLEFLLITDEMDKTTELLENSGFEQNGKAFEKKSDHSPVLQIYIADEAAAALTLFQTTGPDEHVMKVSEKLPKKESFSSEEAIYKAAGLTYLPPESRENPNALHYDADRKRNHLSLSDFKGMIHAHSNYSDGANTLSEMADFCRENGYEYLVITDHSRSAFYANGLEENRIIKQHEEIDKLNQQFQDFTIIKGIESDILVDGSLDYPENILKTFDCVIASIHSGFQMNEEKATNRLIKAIENPHTNILGHLTGRLLLSRSGYPVNHEKVIDACAKNHVAIELNANPHRLDIGWKWLDKMLDKGVLLSINPDAHSLKGFDDTKYGIIMANKACWPKTQLLNYYNVKDLITFFNNNIS